MAAMDHCGMKGGQRSNFQKLDQKFLISSIKLSFYKFHFSDNVT